MLLRTLFEKRLNIAYHVTLSKRDHNIKKQGIHAGPDGGVIYVWGDLHYASWFAELHREDGKQMTIWQVDVSGLDLKRDPEAEDMNEWSSQFEPGEFGEAYIINKQRIDSDRLQGTIER